LSLSWSTFARRSLPEFLALLITTFFGLYLVESFNTREFWLILASAMGIGVSISWFAVMRLWDGSVNLQENYWIGIYINRNSLAPVAAVMMLSVFGAVASTVKRSHKPIGVSVYVVLVVMISTATLGAIELWKSQSQTSPLALAIGAGMCALWVLVRTISARVHAISGLTKYSAVVALALSLIVVLAAMWARVQLGGTASQTTSFNQRGGLWALSWAGFLEKPWHGWGWMAAWDSPLFLLSSSEPAWMAWDLNSSHNGYLDILLGGGLPAGVLFATYLFLAVMGESQLPLLSSIPLFLLTSYVLIAATQESFFSGSHFLWVLLTAGLAFFGKHSESANQKNPA
jgi:O-antigen ligase